MTRASQSTFTNAGRAQEGALHSANVRVNGQQDATGDLSNSSNLHSAGRACSGIAICGKMQQSRRMTQITLRKAKSLQPLGDASSIWDLRAEHRHSDRSLKARKPLTPKHPCVRAHSIDKFCEPQNDI